MSLKPIRSAPFENTCASYDVARSGTKRAPIPIRQGHGGGQMTAPVRSLKPGVPFSISPHARTIDLAQTAR